MQCVSAQGTSAVIFITSIESPTSLKFFLWGRVRDLAHATSAASLQTGSGGHFGTGELSQDVDDADWDRHAGSNRIQLSLYQDATTHRYLGQEP